MKDRSELAARLVGDDLAEIFPHISDFRYPDEIAMMFNDRETFDSINQMQKKNGERRLSVAEFHAVVAAAYLATFSPGPSHCSGCSPTRPAT